MTRTITFIASLALVFTARGDYVIKEELENSGQLQQITLKIKDAKVREDIGGQNSAIIDSNTGETTLLLHSQKAFLKINPEQLKAQADALKDLLGAKTKIPRTSSSSRLANEKPSMDLIPKNTRPTSTESSRASLLRKGFRIIKSSGKRSTEGKVGRRWNFTEHVDSS